MNPKDNILSILSENRVLRIICLLLCGALIVSSFLSFLLFKRPPYVWFITHDGKITNNNGVHFDWEVQEVVRRAVEAFYISSSDREILINSYFSSTLFDYAKKFGARDQFVRFIVEKSDKEGVVIKVQGKLKRPGENDEKLILTLTSINRTDKNPFGLVVSKSDKLEEKEEKSPEGLSVSISSENTNNADKK